MNDAGFAAAAAATMEREPDRNSKFHSKLQQTFKVLFINNSVPHDDTLLEKFSSLLEAKLLQNTSK